jgi:hypothetical protein
VEQVVVDFQQQLRLVQRAARSLSLACSLHKWVEQHRLQRHPQRLAEATVSLPSLVLPSGTAVQAVARRTVQLLALAWFNPLVATALLDVVAVVRAVR